MSKFKYPALQEEVYSECKGGLVVSSVTTHRQCRRISKYLGLLQLQKYAQHFSREDCNVLISTLYSGSETVRNCVLHWTKDIFQALF